MVLLDRYLPEFDFKERHQHDIPASQSEVMAQVLAYRPENDVFFRRMIGLREIPMRVLGRASAGVPPNPDPFCLENFTLLEQSGADEIAFGLVGKFWRLDYGQVRFEDASTFQSIDAPGSAKLVLGFATEPLADNMTRLSTETRVCCPNRATLMKFAPYWFLIRPVSGMIRQRMLRSIGANTLARVQA